MTHFKSSGVAITTNLIALSFPNTSYAQRRILRMALTAATPLLAINTFSMTRPLDPPSSETYVVTSGKRRWRFRLVAGLGLELGGIFLGYF